MPKSYSDQERAYIYRRLKEEAGKCLAQYGIRRTTVDEIVKRANTPKGTFYLYYPSKELCCSRLFYRSTVRLFRGFTMQSAR